MRILVKGAGDLATGIAWRLKKAGHEVVMTDIQVPLSVRRTVAFSRAVYEGTAEVEGLLAVFAPDPDSIKKVLSQDLIPVTVDPEARIRHLYKPDVIVDAIIAKRNTGTAITDAGIVIGIGPGFTAGKDCHCVVETKRGHYLGRVIWEGSAIPNTGIPGDIGGYTTERIIRAASSGIFHPVRNIGDIVKKGELVATSGETPIYALLGGIVRGMLQPGVQVNEGMKCGDIDPRCERDHCFSISDKARAIGGGVLEAVSGFEHKLENTALILLGAGASKRFGSNKLLSIYEGRRMFEYAVDAGCCIKNRILVTGYDEIAAYAQTLGYRVVSNTMPELGISRSIRLGISALTEGDPENVPSSVIFSVCDQPGITASVFERLTKSYAAGNKGLACMALIGENGVEPGNPCLFSRKYFDELMKLEGDHGGKKIILANTGDTVMVTAAEKELKDIDYREKS